MIKKIIVLAISFALTLGTVVYTGVTNADPVKYGSGTGVSRTITSAEELNELLKSLPDYTVYDENANVTNAEGFENFKGITIIENSERSEYLNYKTKIRLDDNPDLPEDQIEYFYKRDHIYENKRLEMYFATDCIYYHAIGTTWTGTEYYEYEDNYSLYGNLEKLEKAYCDATDFDIEVFYSKDKVLFKINKNDTYYQEAFVDGKYNSTGFPKYRKATKPTDDDEDEPSDTEIYKEIALSALEENLGVWVELDVNATGVDDMEPDMDAIENMTPEQQQEYAMNLIIEGLLSELSYQQVESIKAANANNYNYLNKLSTFLTESLAQDGWYEVENAKYKLNNWLLKQDGYVCENCQTKHDEFANQCSNCNNGIIVEFTYHTYDPQIKYIKTLINEDAHVQNSNYDYLSSLEFTYGLNNIIEQKIEKTYSVNNSPNSTRRTTWVSNTSIVNVDNTMVKALKNANVKTLDESYGKSFRKLFNELAKKQGGNK